MARKSATPAAPVTTKADLPPGENNAAGEQTPSPAVSALLISARRDGFRRCGRLWNKAQTRIEIDELSEDEVAVLYAEPMLDVVAVAE